MGVKARRIHLASGNAHKAREMAAIAMAAAGQAGAPMVEIVLPCHLPAVVEDTGTFAGNARKKAVALKAALPPEAWVLADDSGLCVAALDGAPGVESAYYAGPHGDGAANLRKLTEIMRAVPDGKRGAQFVCVLVLLGPDNLEQVFEGRCAGVLRREPAGGGGFGYDPLFVPEGGTATYAELGDAIKNSISHRARAFAQLARWLEANNPVQGSVG
jgi:XTP/dITP diphosphohydrolase